MFAKSVKPGQAVVPHGRIVMKSGIPSIISADLRIRGHLVCSGDIQIDGWIEGDIQSRNIIVGEGATVHGCLQAEEIRIAGLLDGEVRADLVVLEKTARVNGDVLHKSLAIEEGAYLEGMCKRLDAHVVPSAKHSTPPEIAKDTTKAIGGADIARKGAKETPETEAV
jgi:cytoskeletal protein CcmA (bactofilin family)